MYTKYICVYKYVNPYILVNHNNKYIKYIIYIHTHTYIYIYFFKQKCIQNICV